MRRLTPHFATYCPTELEPNATRLLWNLEVLQEVLREKVTVLSLYRTPAQNRQARGAKSSLHLQGKAVDFFVPDLPIARVVLCALVASGRMDQGGVGLYPTHLHYDTGSRRRWGFDETEDEEVELPPGLDIRALYANGLPAVRLTTEDERIGLWKSAVLAWAAAAVFFRRR